MTEIDNILVIGSGKLACSVATCLGQAQESVTLLTHSITESKERINAHRQDINRLTDWEKGNTVDIVDNWNDTPDISLTIVIEGNSLTDKSDLIKEMESSFSKDLIIAVSTDYIPLEQLQKEAVRPQNILVMNWTEPAHTTFFLELVYNEVTYREHTFWLKNHAKNYWMKDPYIIKDELGVRGKMIAALIREAFYLVENGYASIADIDRACRNDAGTYLPFAGNFRYMDLMGTYAYGAVMKKLNKDLSNEKRFPSFLLDIINNKDAEKDNYETVCFNDLDSIKQLKKAARNYSYEIRELMDKYSLNEKNVLSS